MTIDFYSFKFSVVTCGWKAFNVSQSESSISKNFLLRSVDGKHLMHFRVKPVFPNSSCDKYMYLLFLVAYIFTICISVFRLYAASPVVRETVVTLCVVPSLRGENGFTV